VIETDLEIDFAPPLDYEEMVNIFLTFSYKKMNRNQQV